MRDRILRYLMIPLTIGILAYSAAYLAREYTKVDSLVNARDMWSWIAFRADQPAIFWEVDPDDFAAPPYPASGDTLLAINGLEPVMDNYGALFNRQTPIGTRVPITFRHGGETYTTEAVTRGMPGTLRFPVISLFVLRSVLVGALALVGLWAYVRRPGSREVRTLALFCYSMSVSTLLSPGIGADDYARFDIPYHTILLNIFTGVAFFAPVFWLKLQLVFPKKRDFYRRRWFLTNVALFLPGAVVGAFFWTGGINLPLPMVIHHSFFLGAGLALLAFNSRRAESFLARRQTKLVLMGSVPGLLLYSLYPWILFLGQSWFRDWPIVLRLAYANVTYLLVLAIPLTIAYAFGRYRLLEVEGKLKRTTQLVAVNVILLVLFFGVLSIAGDAILDRLPFDSRLPTLTVAFFLAIGFAPAQRIIRRFLEGRLYPERIRLRRLLRDFLGDADRSTDAAGFWKELSTKLREGLGVETIEGVLRAPDGESFVTWDEERTPFRTSDHLIVRLAEAGSPLLLDEVLASGRITLVEEQVRWLEARRAAILLPLMTGSGTLGFIAVGRKEDDEDFGHEELGLLESLAPQIALTAENRRLLEERVEKEKMQEQLAMGRKIQEGLLPAKIPETPSLDLAARIRFSLEVAGDYYDVIPLAEGRTLFAVGDVAGKGVGAALLMASLQASLRTARALSVSLTDLVSQLNRHVFENTPQELFITLFVALFDPPTGKLSYVNAGHNYPVLARAGGIVSHLDRGGLLLGVDPDAKYEEAHVELAEDDRVLLFTDGACEALNENEEEFGEDRIAELFAACKDRDLDRCLDKIEDEVVRFSGSSDFADDFTLLVVRRNGS